MIQQNKDLRAKTASADDVSCSKKQSHAWAECANAAKTVKELNGCK